MERILLTGQRRRGALLAIVLLLGTIGAAVGDPAPLPHPAPALPPAAIAAARDLFSMPGDRRGDARSRIPFRGGGSPAAEAILDRLIDQHPTVGELQAGRAALLLLAGAPGPALDRLEVAVRLGYRDVAALIADPLFAPLMAAALPPGGSSRP